MADDLIFTQCNACRFWADNENGKEGFCHRHAPRPSERSLQVARWPETRAMDGCGDGEVAHATRVPPTCQHCIFWLRPGQGIEPGLRGDHQASWWRGAGFCRRFAPYPGVDSGAHAFWRITHDDDHCFDGRPSEAAF